MLGNYSRGMTVDIPVRFQDDNKNGIEMENVIVNIEYFNKNSNKVEYKLKETGMEKVGIGDYLYRYKIPANSDDGNYLVRIRAKKPGTASKVFETTEHFVVADGATFLQPVIKNESVERVEQLTPVDESGDDEFEREKAQLIQNHNEAMSKSQQQAGGMRSVDDIVVDVNNKPIEGVHITVYDKTSFVPNSPSNVKVASAITNSDGKWVVNLAPGDYIFTYKAIGKKENREFRKVQ